MPVPLSRTRKRASKVQRSCNQILLAETQGATVGLPTACRFYNVGGLYGVGARSRFVRQAIKKRTQLCCNCEGVNLTGDIASRRVKSETCNPRSNDLVDYETSRTLLEQESGGLEFENNTDIQNDISEVNEIIEAVETTTEETATGETVTEETTTGETVTGERVTEETTTEETVTGETATTDLKNLSVEETNEKHSGETVENDERVIIIDNTGDPSFTKEEVEFNKSQDLPYRIGFISSYEDVEILTERGINIIKGARDLLESIISKTTGYIRDGVDLKVRIMVADLGYNETEGSTLAQSMILKLARSVYGVDHPYYPIEGLIYINSRVIDSLLNEPAIMNNNKVPKLFTTIIHELLHILCIGIHPNLNFGWGSPKLGLVSDMTSMNAGWLYTGKHGSKAVSFYRDVYCNNSNIIGIPIEDDDGYLGHLEEGYDNDGNFGIRTINGIEHYPVPFEIMSTYHSNISFTSPITFGILEDYGYEIDWNNKELVSAINIQKEKASAFTESSLGKAIADYFS